MGTIVQEYGPFYGEAVNGTVSGRPNGSVYVPLFNTVSLQPQYSYFTPFGSVNYATCNSSGSIKYDTVHRVATAQDLSSAISTEIFEDEACESKIGKTYYLAAGRFNHMGSILALQAADDTITDGTTYYFRSQLINNGVPVATSDVVPLVAVIP